jgi:hypothetical protein
MIDKSMMICLSVTINHIETNDAGEQCKEALLGQPMLFQGQRKLMGLIMSVDGTAAFKEV